MFFIFSHLFVIFVRPFFFSFFFPKMSFEGEFLVSLDNNKNVRAPSSRPANQEKSGMQAG
jgi:hypothetical protein